MDPCLIENKNVFIFLLNYKQSKSNYHTNYCAIDNASERAEWAMNEDECLRETEMETKRMEERADE